MGDSSIVPPGSARGPAAERDAFTTRLDTFVLEKALYELRYELNNRPAWATIPLTGMLKLMHA
jgi:predicted trehalose synthase